MARYDDLDLRSALHGREWVIERRALRERVDVRDLVGVIGWLPQKVEAELAAQLLLRLPSEMPTGRCPLYICHLCGDLDCGTISARVARVEDCYVWSDFASESPYGSQPARWIDDERDFYFAAEEYEALLVPLARGARRR